MSNIQTMINDAASDAIVMSLLEYISDTAVDFHGINEDDVGSYMIGLSVEQWNKYIDSYVNKLKDSNGPVNLMYDHIAPMIGKTKIIGYLNSLDVPSVVDKIKTIE